MLTEFCETTGYNRKYAIRWLNGPEPKKGVGKRRGRRSSYGGQEIRVVSGVWEAAGVSVVGAAEGTPAGVDALGAANTMTWMRRRKRRFCG